MHIKFINSQKSYRAKNIPFILFILISFKINLIYADNNLYKDNKIQKTCHKSKKTLKNLLTNFRDLDSKEAFPVVVKVTQILDKTRFSVSDLDSPLYGVIVNYDSLNIDINQHLCIFGTFSYNYGQISINAYLIVDLNENSPPKYNILSLNDLNSLSNYKNTLIDLSNLDLKTIQGPYSKANNSRNSMQVSQSVYFNIMNNLENNLSDLIDYNKVITLRFNTRRDLVANVFDRVEKLKGLLVYEYSKYYLYVDDIKVINLELDDIKPHLHENLRIASFNLQNYFTSQITNVNNLNNQSRGIKNINLFLDKEERILNAISYINADIIILNEIENNSYQSGSAIERLTSKLKRLNLNYTSIKSNLIYGKYQDYGAITNIILYKKDKISNIDDFVIDLPYIVFKDKSIRHRRSINAHFNYKGFDFIVSANHFKSKRQACNNLEKVNYCDDFRSKASLHLVNELKKYNLPTIIGGDLNAYPFEKPIKAIINSGYINPFKNNFSYKFKTLGQIDYLLISDTLSDRIVYKKIWHINSISNFDTALFNSYSMSSDHDPVIVDFNFQ